MKQYDIAVIGGGIGGLMATLALQKKGFRVTLYEAAKELKPVGAGLVVGSNALSALIELGVGQELKEHANTLNQLIIQSYNGDEINKVDFASIGTQFGV